MSWYRDPQLFIYQFVAIHRVTVEFGIRPVVTSDLKEGENLSFSKHLSLLGHNKEGDFDAFKASFPKSGNGKFINNQGLVFDWPSGTWSHEEPNSPFWSLPGITKPKSSATLLANNQALADENAELKAKISSLQDE
ncbi:hypothetical protein MKW92_020784, partial [Papaver armeniacum]